MRYSFLLVLSVLLAIISYCQPKPFEQGFEKGFKEGYCYNQSITCLPPLTPICPLPRVNENENSFTDGYNRGFQVGLDLKRTETGLNSNSSSINYSSFPNYRFNDYIPTVPINDYVNVLLYKKALMEKRIQWVNNRTLDIGDLNYVLLYNLNQDYYNANLTTLNNFINNQLKAKNPDLTDDRIFTQVVSIFSKIQKDIYDNYSIAKQEQQKLVVNDDKSLIEMKLNLFITLSNGKFLIQGVKNNSIDTIIVSRYKTFTAKLDQQQESDDNLVVYLYAEEYESYYQINYGYLKKHSNQSLSMDFLGNTKAIVISNNNQYILVENGENKTDDVEARGQRQFLTKNGNTFEGSYYENPKERKYFICNRHYLI